MAFNSLQPVVWEEDRLRETLNDVVKIVTKELKDDVWYNYSFCFKKCKNGEIIIRNPTPDEFGKISKV